MRRQRSTQLLKLKTRINKMKQKLTNNHKRNNNKQNSKSNNKKKKSKKKSKKNKRRRKRRKQRNRKWNMKQWPEIGQWLENISQNWKALNSLTTGRPKMAMMQPKPSQPSTSLKRSKKTKCSLNLLGMNYNRLSMKLHTNWRISKSSIHLQLRKSCRCWKADWQRRENGRIQLHLPVRNSTYPTGKNYQRHTAKLWRELQNTERGKRPSAKRGVWSRSTRN